MSLDVGCCAKTNLRSRRISLSCPMQVRVPDNTVRPNKSKWRSLQERKVYCRAEQGERVAHAQKTPISPKGFSKAFVKAR